MSARVYLTSGRFVDVPDATVTDLAAEFAKGDSDAWITTGDDGTGGAARAFRVGAAECVVAI